jgi:hypothetical protein
MGDVGKKDKGNREGKTKSKKRKEEEQIPNRRHQITAEPPAI